MMGRWWSITKVLKAIIILPQAVLEVCLALPPLLVAVHAEAVVIKAGADLVRRGRRAEGIAVVIILFLLRVLFLPSG